MSKFDSLNGEWKDTIYTKYYEGNGCVLGTVSQKYAQAKNKFWKKEENGWNSLSIANESIFNVPDTLSNGMVRLVNQNNYYFNIPCIYAEVNYIKEKNKSAFKEPKKRKLNKLERIKEDSFIYPQNSVQNLFSSLIKAFENEEYVYVLKYLCIYDDNELNTILNEFDNQNPGDVITEKEKNDIILHLKEIQASLTDTSLVEINSSDYELSYKSKKYYLSLKDGKWRINPYSRTII